MKVFLTIIITFFLTSVNCFSQTNEALLQGLVTFVTTNNAYVKFDNTDNIEIGDTLMLKQENGMIPCLLVTNKSSISCVSSIINGCTIKKEDIIFHNSVIKTKKNKPLKEPISVNPSNSIYTEDSLQLNKTENINGRVSVASYSNLNASRGNSHRTNYHFSLNANHINNTRYSIETYLNYRQNFLPKESTSSIKNNYFNIYNLALRYDIKNDLSVIIGRKINNNASSLGAIDGIQAEKFFNNFYTGIIAGFRPDIFNYGFNSDLLEYGTYIGLKTDNKNIYSRSTLGILEQRNKSNVDRRYTYFQHSSTIKRNLNLFTSFELDLFNQLNGKSFNNARLTNLYISTGYRISRKVNVNLSYDSRKRILYYETFKTDIEQLLENDEARQGLRFRVNFRPFKYTSTGISYSQRFQSSGQNKSDNINGYFTLSKIPTIDGLISINYNRNISNYLESNMLSIRHSRYFAKKKLNAGMYFRTINYNYAGNEFFGSSSKSYNQNYYGVNFSYNLKRKLTFTILGELASLSDDKNYRLNASIIKRFSKK